MNYEELLVAKAGGKLNQTQMPIGEFYRAKVDNKYQSRVDLHRTLIDNITFCEGLKRECGFWKGECEKLKSVITSAAVENAFLKNCIMLSVSSIRQFLHFVKHINSKALIHTFLVKTVSPDMGPEALEVINQAVDLEETAEGKLADQIIIDNSGVIEHR